MNLDPADQRAVWLLLTLFFNTRGKTPKASQRSSGLPPQFQRESITSVNTSQTGAPGRASRTSNSYPPQLQGTRSRGGSSTSVSPEGETAAPISLKGRASDQRGLFLSLTT